MECRTGAGVFCDILDIVNHLREMKDYEIRVEDVLNIIGNFDEWNSRLGMEHGIGSCLQAPVGTDSES